MGHRGAGVKGRGRAALVAAAVAVAVAGLAGPVGAAGGTGLDLPPGGTRTEALTVSSQAGIAAEFAVTTSAAAFGHRALQHLDLALAGHTAHAPDSAPAISRRVHAVLRPHADALARFVAFVALSPAWEDAGHELTERLVPALRPDDVDAARAMLIGSIGVADPDRDPAVAALEDYRRALQALVAAAAPLAARMAMQRDHDRIGGPDHGGKDDRRFRQLVAQFGETLADVSVYIPSSPPELFRPRVPPPEKVFDVALLWDDHDNEWHRVAADVPVEDIFRDVFIATGKRPTPGQLKYLAGTYGQIGVRRATIEAIADVLDGAAPESPVRLALARSPDGEALRAALAERWRLSARYVYDAAFRAAMLRTVDEVRQGLVEQAGPAAADLRRLDDLLGRFGLTLDSQWAAAVPPSVGTLKVTAWFSDDPRTKFTSIWRFDKEEVRIDIDQGRATGVRRGNVVQTEGSIPGRNCIATDVRTFAPDGRLSFSASYRCVRENGVVEVSNRVGLGTWEVVGDDARPSSPVQQPAANRRSR
ncbi:hypothetical protein [Rhodoplanes serenus]|uniref:hypothetical protein n=1 Tax=Rhodoplanes serenus TaxID=200615 RepID=UPI0012D7B5F3|nr:hypothetical protein [Rhodoplanes serenus]